MACRILTADHGFKQQLRTQTGYQDCVFYLPDHRPWIQSTTADPVRVPRLCVLLRVYSILQFACRILITHHGFKQQLRTQSRCRDCVYDLGNTPLCRSTPDHRPWVQAATADTVWMPRLCVSPNTALCMSNPAQRPWIQASTSFVSP